MNHDTAHSNTPRRKWLRGEQRHQVSQDVIRRYRDGESIRAIAASIGRSYGFVHRILTESNVTKRTRGGPRRRRRT